MATSDENGGFWKTIPGMLTAAAGLISAATALVVALNQTGVFTARKTPEAIAAAPATDGAVVSGSWKANVTYSWGATYTERFAFQADKDRLTGTVTFLGAPRGIESGAVNGDRITFIVRLMENVGSETRPYQLSYRGTMVGGGIHFELDDSRGNPSVQFAAARALPQ